MVTNILIAGAFFALGILTGVMMTGRLILSKYKKCPIGVILLIDQYAQKL